MSQLLSPSGRLVCLEWPSTKPLQHAGPPWPLRPDIYLAHLLRPGDEVPYAADGQLLAGGPAGTGPASDAGGGGRGGGLRRLAHVKPRRTYKSGYDADGNVTDNISVWAHDV